MKNPQAPLAKKLFDEQGLQELKRHASVSTDNRHYCQTCFCCACYDLLRKVYYQLPDNERKKIIDNGFYWK